MKKSFVVLSMLAVLFCAACSTSSKDDTSDPCTDDPSAPECRDEEDSSEQEGEQEEEQEEEQEQEEKQVQEPATEEE